LVFVIRVAMVEGFATNNFYHICVPDDLIAPSPAASAS